MAKQHTEVIIRPLAERQITAISIYIEQKGYPLTAEKFANKLYDFAESLAVSPLKYALCKNELLQKKKFHCAVFQKTYVFIYKLIRNRVIVYQVGHGSRLLP